MFLAHKLPKLYFLHKFPWICVKNSKLEKKRVRSIFTELCKMAISPPAHNPRTVKDTDNIYYLTKSSAWVVCRRIQGSVKTDNPQKNIKFFLEYLFFRFEHTGSANNRRGHIGNFVSSRFSDIDEEILGKKAPRLLCLSQSSKKL